MIKKYLEEAKNFLLFFAEHNYEIYKYIYAKEIDYSYDVRWNQYGLYR